MKSETLLLNGRRASASLFAVTVLSLALAGCASLAGKPEDLVRESAQARWNALVAGDFIKAHGYSTAGFKAVVPADRYRERVSAPVQWKGAQVHSVECPEKDSCKVRVRIDYSPLMMRGKPATFDTYINEVWVLDEGRWAIYQKL